MPQLTGIRSVAFLMVFLFHAGFPGFFLWSGVDLFFVLSGFLITGILLAQEKDSDYFKVFYARRFLRIFPPFYAVLVLSIFALEKVSGWQATSIALFMANFYMPFADRSSASMSYWALGPYWSLALEEQFYLLWPLVVYKLSPRQLLRVCILLIISAPLLRGLTHVYLLIPQHATYEAISQLPWNRMDLLAAGAAIAVCRHLGILKEDAMAQRGILLMIASAAVILIAALLFPDFRYSGHSLLFSMLGFTALCGLMSGVIMYLVGASQGPVVALLSCKPVVYLGTISYAMYLLHGTVLVVLEYQLGIPSGWPLIFSAFLSTFLLAALSWHTLELPIKRLKDSPWLIKYLHNDKTGRKPATDIP